MVAMTASKTVADQLREAIRKELAAGRSLSDISKAADYSVGSLHRFVSGTGSLNIETATALAKALKVKIVIG